MSEFEIQWIDSGREPQCAPDPAYPEGKDLYVTDAMPSCKADLPYPAKRCGIYVVKCTQCGFSVACTTAGRPDDPRSIALPCREKVN